MLPHLFEQIPFVPEVLFRTGKERGPPEERSQDSASYFRSITSGARSARKPNSPGNDRCHPTDDDRDQGQSFDHRGIELLHSISRLIGSIPFTDNLSHY